MRNQPSRSTSPIATPPSRLGRWIFGTTSIDRAFERAQTGPASPAGDLLALGRGDAQLDALEALADARRDPCPPIDGERSGLRAVVAGQQANAEALVEALGDAGGSDEPERR